MHGFGLIFDADHKRPLTQRDFVRAGIDGRFSQASFDLIPKDAPYYKQVKWYIDHIAENINKSTGLILTGIHGGGKSGTAAVLVKEVMARGGSALFIEEATLIDFVFTQERFSDDRSYLERAQEVDLLVIDDLGMSPNTENLNITERVVKFRMRHPNRATVITTNLTRSEFVERYPTVAEAEGEVFIPVVCEGVPWRDFLAKELRDQFRRESGGS